MKSKNIWILVGLVVIACIGAVFAIKNYREKRVNTKTPAQQVRIVENLKKRLQPGICNGDFGMLQFTQVEADNLETLAQLTNKKLKTGAKLSRSAEITYEFKNGAYKTIYVQNFEEHNPPTVEYFKHTFGDTMREVGYTEVQIDEVAKWIEGAKKNCK